MPRRKYKPKQGKYGPIYNVGKGVKVRQDARSKWLLCIEKGGKRKNITIGVGSDALDRAIRVAEEVASKIDSLVVDKPEGDRAGSPLFKTYSSEWLKGNASRWSQDTIQRYDEICRRHIWPSEVLTGKRLDQVERNDIKRLLRKKLGPYAPATVGLIHTVLCGVFDEAVDDGYLEINPARGLRKKILPPKRQRNLKNAEPFTVEERDLFLGQAQKTCPWRMLMLLKVMAFAGLRLGEALAMRIDNLDFHNKTYRVVESFKGYRFRKPKFGKRRQVDLPGFLVEEMQRYILYLKKEGLKEGSGADINLLFLDPKEKNRWPYSQRRIQEIMKQVCRKAGLGIRNPHDLRHTYATILLMAHQSPVYVKEQLGHTSISTTVDIYGHWFSGEGRNRLDEALLGKVRDESEKRIFSHMSEAKRP